MPDGLDASPPNGVTLPAAMGAPAPVTATVIRIAPDGGVIIHDSAPASRPETTDFGKFNENLAKKLPASAMATIVEDIIQGIESDEQSRKGFIDNYTKGIELLGLKIEEQSNTRSQKRNVSRVRNPLLLEACVRGQSAARAELLPAGGPCKVSTIGGTAPDEDTLARAFEADMNYYLTTVAKEYYPDFDRGLFELYFGGNLFKKVYTCPVRRRPVSDTINVSDLIVSEDARDLNTATRVTHRSMMAPGLVKRMMWSGAWIEVELGTAMPNIDPAKRKEREAMGTGVGISRPEDQERCIYETMYDIDLGRWEGMKETGQPDGLALPYVVTIDKDSRQILALRRNWKDGDKLFMRRQRYVHYCLVPGLSFLGMGYLHLLGNQTRALTAMWRVICDSGMFACFPGGVKAKGLRMSTNEIQPGPGEWVDVDIGPFDRIQDAMMPMPYKDPSPVFIQFAEIVGQDAQRMAGSIEMEVGEGRTNIPVGTIMSMIEQQTQVMAAVHKRLHTAQAQELLLIRAEFAENPETLQWLNREPGQNWTKAAEFMNLNLVPASDPNIPAQTHRVMQATALVTLASTNPDIYDKLQVHKHALRTMGIINSDPFLHAPVPMPPDPSQAGGKAPDPLGPQKLQLEQQEQQRKAAQETVEASRRQQEMTARNQGDMAELASRERIAQSQEQTQRLRLQTEQARMNSQEARADAETKHKIGLENRAHVRDDLMAAHQIKSDRSQAAVDGLSAQHEMDLGGIEQQREDRLAQHQIGKDRHEAGLAARQQGLDAEQAGHEMDLGHREAAREDRLATHQMKQPITKPEGKRTRRARPKTGAKK